MGEGEGVVVCGGDFDAVVCTDEAHEGEEGLVARG